MATVQRAEQSAAVCQHCQSHTRGQDCPGLHGCSAELAPVMSIAVTPRIRQVRLALLLATMPRIVTLAFAPPLRPPHA